MNVICLLSIFFLCSCVLSSSLSKNLTSRPDAVHVGALFTFDSIIGRVSKIAIEEAVKDINSNFSVLHGTKLKLTMQNTNCSGFLGMVEALQFMGTDIVAIVGPQSSVIAHIISQVASELQVPLLSFAATDPTLSSLQFPFFVRTTQSDLHQMDAIADIVSYYGWREVVAVYSDDQYGRNGVSALDNALAERRCRVPYKAGINPASIGNRTEITDLLVKVALLESRVIVLHVNPDSGSQVFSVAHYLGMMGNGFVWIATDWLSAFLDSSASVSTDSMQGVLVLRQHTPDSDRKRAVTSQWKKLSGDSIFLNSYGIYAYDTVWLVAYAIDAFFNQGGNISFSSASRLSSAGKGKVQLEAMSIFDGGKLLLKNILKSDFSGLTGRVKFNSDRSLAFPAYDIINVIGTGLRQIGYWSSESGLSTMSPETLDMKLVNHSNPRQRLYSVIWPGETIMTPRGWVFQNNGKQLRIGVPRRVSYKEFVSQIPGTDMFKGFCIDVFVAAVNLLPYAVPYQFIPFGDGHKNPSYNDLVHSITTGVFDAVVGDISIVTNRTRIVDFTQPYATSDLVVVTSFRKMNSGAWAFLRPLSPFMWGVTATFLLAIGIVVWILEHRINDEFRGPPRKQMMTILWFSFSTLFFAHRENTLSTLGRMVLIIWLFVVLVINSSYTASLTSILTVQRLYSSIKGIETLQAGDKPIGYQLGSFAEYFLREELNISKSRLVPLGSPDEFANALQLGPEKGGVAAAVDERPYVDLFLASQCNFRVVGRDLTRSGWGFAFPRDSSLAVDLSTAILTLSENGDLQRIHDKWLTRPTCSLESTDFEPDRLHLKSFWGLFVICGIACLLALLIYFCRIMRKFFRAGPESDLGGGGGSARSRRLRALLSFLDEKKGDSSHGNKRRIIETPSADSYKEDELGRNPKRRQTESDFVDN